MDFSWMPVPSVQDVRNDTMKECKRQEKYASLFRIVRCSLIAGGALENEV